MNKKWSEKTKLEKTMDIIAAIAICVWFVFERLESGNKVPYAGVGIYVSLCIACICEAVSFWNTKRVLSYVAIGGTVLMLAAVVLQML